MSTFIYALCDPETDEVRYVGKTINLQHRLSQHCSAHRDAGGKTHCERWLHSLKSPPRIVSLLKLEPHESWQDWERAAIALLKICGFRLTNATSGGDGVDSALISRGAKEMWARKRQDPVQMAAWSAMAKKRAQAMADRCKVDPEFDAARRENLRKNRNPSIGGKAGGRVTGAMVVGCADCSVTGPPGPMGVHRKFTKHRAVA